jgi:Cytochrome c7 and related cytochrome c
MPQIFHRSFNTISKVTILGAVFILAGAGWAYARYIRSSYATGVGVAREQPVPFSHQHHVSGLGIDCRYCHTSVETSGYAGIPPVRTCMNCHNQIWVSSPLLEPIRESYKTGKALAWARVNNLADFVYFDHSIHVKKGVGCSTCHGPVHQMPLTYQYATLHMEWCLECHRSPERFVRPRDQVFNMDWQPPPDQEAKGHELMREYNIRRRTDCSTCHR